MPQDDELISVIDAARQLGKRKQAIFKILRRLAIIPRKRRDSSRRNQMISYISGQDLQRVAQEVALEASTGRASEASTAPSALDPEKGHFYLIQLEPELDPGRFKVGFAVNMPERLRTLRCSAPFSRVVKKWPCKRGWEKTAIDTVSAGCERLHTEVFRTKSLEDVEAKCERLFELLPDPK